MTAANDFAVRRALEAYVRTVFVDLLRQLKLTPPDMPTPPLRPRQRPQLRLIENEASKSKSHVARFEKSSVPTKVLVKKRLENLAKSTGRSRSFLTAEAPSEYLDVNEWQVAGVRSAPPQAVAVKVQATEIAAPPTLTTSPLENP